MDINIGEGVEVIELSGGESTPGEDLGGLIGQIHQARMAWGVYIKRLERNEIKAVKDEARNMWDRLLRDAINARMDLEERMQRERLAQVTTTGYKARIEGDTLAIYRVTDEGEERWTV